jgi:large subunit ribosomal protein L4
MPKVAVRTIAGSDAGSLDLDDATFGLEPNVAVLHQVVNAQLAARRAGTHSTKTRSEVRGGGAKPWKQKGTGRARAGSSRSSVWVGGGIAHGPKPRSYAQRTNKKMIRLATRSALSDRFAEQKLVVVDQWNFDRPSTKAAKAALSALGVDGKVLLVVSRDDENTVRSFRNLPQVNVLACDQLNAFDILVSDYVVFSKASLPAALDSSSATAAMDAAAMDAAAMDAAAMDAAAMDTAESEES